VWEQGDSDGQYRVFDLAAGSMHPRLLVTRPRPGEPDLTDGALYLTEHTGPVKQYPSRDVTSCHVPPIRALIELHKHCTRKSDRDLAANRTSQRRVARSGFQPDRNLGVALNHVDDLHRADFLSLCPHYGSAQAMSGLCRHGDDNAPVRIIGFG
jgi:hypothetical protein